MRYCPPDVRSVNSGILIAWAVLVLCLFELPLDVPACLNPIGRSEMGTRIDVANISLQEFLDKFRAHEDRQYWTTTLNDLEFRLGHYPHHSNPNNIAVAMVHLGRIKEAINILEQMERDKPRQYHTAANLGTAYELDGQNEKALDWIKKGVERNADSHGGTEWLHVKILEAKIALQTDSEWLRTHPVLGVDLSTLRDSASDVAIVDHLGGERTLHETESALIYQLHERMEFVKPQEPVVADLLYDLSAVMSIIRTPEHAAAIRNMAVLYGPGHPRNQSRPVLDKLIDTSLENRHLWFVAFAFLAIAVGLAVFLVTRNRR